MTLLYGPVQPGDDFVAARCALSWQPPGQPIGNAVHLGYLEKIVNYNQFGEAVVIYRFSRAVYASTTRDAVMNMVLEECQRNSNGLQQP